MEEVKVIFYEDVFTAYDSVVILADNLEMFNRELDRITGIVQERAEKEEVELAGARYNLPDKWQEPKRRKR